MCGIMYCSRPGTGMADYICPKEHVEDNVAVCQFHMDAGETLWCRPCDIHEVASVVQIFNVRPRHVVGSRQHHHDREGIL